MLLHCGVPAQLSPVKPRASQQGVAQRTPDQTTACPDGLTCAPLLQTGIDLDQIHGDQLAGLMHTLCDIVPFSEGQTSAHGRARRWRPLRIQRVDVKGEMDRRIRPDVTEGHFHDAADTVAIDVMHAEGSDSVFAEDLFLAAVDVAEADVDEFGEADELVGSQPAEDVALVRGGEAGQEGDGHAVDVAGVGRFRRVDVGVRVDPDDGDFSPVEPLADGFGGAGDGADCDAVIAAEGEDEAAFFGLGVYSRAEGFGDGGDGARIFHAAMVGVWRTLWSEIIV